MDTPTTATASTPLVFPTGTELYDSLMKSIEPELLSANVKHLDDAYMNESEEDRKKRYERYTQAYANYDKAYAAWEAGMQKNVQQYRKHAFRSAEAKSRIEEAAALKKIEEAIEVAPVNSAH